MCDLLRRYGSTPLRLITARGRHTGVLAHVRFAVTIRAGEN